MTQPALGSISSILFAILLCCTFPVFVQAEAKYQTPSKSYQYRTIKLAQMVEPAQRG